MHLSLGIYNRLCSLLGEAFNELDLKLSESSEESIGSGSTYNHYVGSMRRRSGLATELDNQQNELIVLNEMMTFTSISLPDAEDNDVLKELRKDADATHTSVNNMVNVSVSSYTNVKK